TEAQIQRVACTEPTLRDMLQQFRHLFDSVVFPTPGDDKVTRWQGDRVTEEPAADRLPPVEPPRVKSVVIVESPTPAAPPAPPVTLSPCHPVTLSGPWDQEVRSARRKLEPEGALTGATRELQAGLGAFLRIAHEHGVKVGPWRLQHVVPELTFGEHPTYGVLTIAHWVC